LTNQVLEVLGSLFVVAKLFHQLFVREELINPSDLIVPHWS